MKHIVCLSGGVGSALAAIATAEKHGTGNLTLLNHDISPKVEHEDIKRFKRDIAEFIGVKITYANADNWEQMTPCAVCKLRGAIHNPENHQALCTYYLKTLPFGQWLKSNYPAEGEQIRDDLRIIYGFGADEEVRITRRVGIIGAQGYKCAFPLLEEHKPLEHYGIKRPITYKLFKHANCMGCLKAGKQHWYVTYCLRPDIVEEAIETERETGYTILKEESMESLIPFFKETQAKGICPNEHNDKFWQQINSVIPEQIGMLPCDCSF